MPLLLATWLLARFRWIVLLVQLKRALLDSKNIRKSLPLVQVPKPSTDLAPAEAAVCLVAGAGGTTSKICVWTCSLWCLIEMVDLQLWR